MASGQHQHRNEYQHTHQRPALRPAPPATVQQHPTNTVAPRRQPPVQEPAPPPRPSAAAAAFAHSPEEAIPRTEQDGPRQTRPDQAIPDQTLSKTAHTTQSQARPDNTRENWPNAGTNCTKTGPCQTIAEPIRQYQQYQSRAKMRRDQPRAEKTRPGKSRQDQTGARRTRPGMTRPDQTDQTEEWATGGGRRATSDRRRATNEGRRTTRD